MITSEGVDNLEQNNDASPLSDTDPAEEISKSWIKLEKGAFFDPNGPRGSPDTPEIEQVDNSSEEERSQRFERSDEGAEEGPGQEEEDEDVFSKYASVSLEERAEMAMEKDI